MASRNRRLMVVLGLLAVVAAALFLVFRGDGKKEPVATVTPLVVDSPETSIVQTESPSEDTKVPGADVPAADPAKAAPAPAPAPATPAAGAPASNDLSKDPIKTAAGHQIDTSGAVRITPSMDVKLSRKNMQLLRHYELGTTTMKVKLCITEHGVVHSIDVVRSSGVKEVDTDMTNQLRTWRYLPAVANGVPAASCQDVTLNYQLVE